MQGQKVHFDFSHIPDINNMQRHTNHKSLNLRDRENGLYGSNTRIPVRITSTSTPNDTLEHVEDPFDDASHHMDHEVERVLREWDTNTQRITHNTFRLRPSNNIQGTSSTPNSPFNKRKNRMSNSTSNLSVSGDFATGSTSHRRNFEIPEINVSRREDSRLDTSVESLTEDLKSPIYSTCEKTGVKYLKMEFDTEGYGPENFTVRVAEQKLIIHAQQNETVAGRTSTTEFCRKVKLPVDVNSKMLHCYYNPETKMLIAEAPVVIGVRTSSQSMSPPSFTNTSDLYVKSPQMSPHLFTRNGDGNGMISPVSNITASQQSSVRPQLLNIPIVRPEMFGKTMYLNVELGPVFKPDDVTVKVKGQDKIIVSASRVENNENSKLNASIQREFDLPDKIIAKTLKAGLSAEGILKVSALLQDHSLNGLGEQISVEVEDNGMEEINDGSNLHTLDFKVN